MCRGWTLEKGEHWTFVTPTVPHRRLQGWKLHVSATVVSAPEVLKQCLPLLVEAQVPFKFASTRESLRFLNDFRVPRGQSGKFITIYPSSDATCAALAPALDSATAGLPGPKILSDASYREGSLVHYRYGVFDGVRMLSNDGRYLSCIMDPDGVPREDVRPVRFKPPGWVRSPFAQAVESSEGNDQPDPTVSQDQTGTRGVLLNDRYAVLTAIRHANKGGVYRAHDRTTGSEVIIKEARPHVGTDFHGRDAIDQLRHEARILRLLAPLGVAPALLDEFDQQDHHFFVEELVPGVSVRKWVEESRDGLPLSMLASIVRRLRDILERVHEVGVVLRDFNPNNIMIDGDLTLRLIDLELAAVRDGDDGQFTVFGKNGGTPGISAPEQFRGADVHRSVDCYSLGATIFVLATRSSPLLMRSDPDGRSPEDRLAELMEPPLAPVALPAQLRRTITALMREEPLARPQLSEIATAFASEPSEDIDLWRNPTVHEATSTLEQLSDEQWTELVDGALRYFEKHCSRPFSGRPWPETGFGEEIETCTVQHGLAGTLAVLARLSHLRADATVVALQESISSAIVRHLGAERHRLPGLFYGASGTAWSLVDAGRALGRTDLVERGIGVALSLPTAWPNPDLTHGLSGLGTCLLYLAQQTGRADLLERGVACAEEVDRMAKDDGGRVYWKVPESFDSELAGYSSYGFAHGTAGIGAFLLWAGSVGNRAGLLRRAEQCGDVLLDAAVRENGASYWPATPGASVNPVHWCNGSSGVGSFLCRLYAITGEKRFLLAAEEAARAVMITRWRVGNAYCHGLAGNGDFLIDMAQVTGDEEFLRWSRSIAHLLWARRVNWNGAVMLADESGEAVTGGYGAGSSGHLSFLVRLRDGGARLFHPYPTAVHRRPS